MNWQELKTQIEQMTPEQQVKDVQVWGEFMPATNAKLETAKENMFWHNSWDFVYPESALDDKQILADKAVVYIAKDEPYLWCE